MTPGRPGEVTGLPAGGAPTVPPAVAALAGPDEPHLVWRNEVGGLTYRLGDGPGRRFAKWVPAASGLDLAAEAERLRWAVRYTAVPVVLDAGGDASGDWLLTAGLDGESAVGERWLADPGRAVAAIGRGLRALHDALPVTDCPFTWSAQQRVRVARGRVAAGLRQLPPWHPEHRDLDPAQALARLSAPPPIERAVVCHGDACAPNSLIRDDGRWSGHVDLGTLGVADRWADLAIATWSTVWNYGPGYEDRLLDAYGIGPDPERTAYYRLLWDLT